MRYKYLLTALPHYRNFSCSGIYELPPFYIYQNSISCHFSSLIKDTIIQRKATNRTFVSTLSGNQIEYLAIFISSRTRSDLHSSELYLPP